MEGWTELKLKVFVRNGGIESPARDEAGGVGFLALVDFNAEQST